MYSKLSNHQLILAGVLVLTIILGALIIICPPALFPDPSWGFQVMRSMQLGGGFNLNISPSHENIAQNTSTFLTWWSPGQYLLPYTFKVLLGVNQGQSAAVTILFCDVSGLLGFYFLFRKLGFTQMVASFSIAFIFCQQYFFIPYIFYNGGETLLFGFLSWFLLGCFTFENLTWKPLVFVLLCGWAGFFCKSAFLWMYAAGVLCLWINVSIKSTQISRWLKNGALLALPFLLSIFCIYLFFLSRGSNPAAASAGFHLSVEALSFPLASPLLSGFSIDEILHGLIFHQDKPLFGHGWSIAVLLVLAIVSIALFMFIIRSIPHFKYKLAVTAFYIVSILFFTSFFLRQLDISYEGRHFRIVGVLFVPGVVYLFSQAKPYFKSLAIIFWVVIAFTSVRYFYYGYKYNIKVSAHGPSGFSQLFIDQPSLNYLQALDKQYANTALFVFVSADLGLEIINNRMATFDEPDGINPATYKEDNLFAGHAGPVFILLPAYYTTNGNAGIIRQCFPGYGNFSIKKLSKEYVLMIGR